MTTYSFLSCALSPGRNPTTFFEANVLLDTDTLARIVAFNLKCGSGCCCLAASRISSKACPDPASKSLAFAGSQLALNFRPRVKESAGSARLMRGIPQDNDCRAQGISTLLGSGMATMPTAPADRNAFHRSAVEE